MRKIAAPIAALLIGLTGCAATDTSSGSGSGGGDDSGLNSDASHPNRIKAGHAAQLGDFKILKGWKPHKEGFGLGWTINNLSVKNTTKGDHTFSVVFKLHKGPHRVVASVNCFADQAHAGEVIDVDCVPDGKGKPWKFITVENDF